MSRLEPPKKATNKEGATITLHQYFCVDSIECLNKKTRLAASTPAFWALRYASILLNLSGTYLWFITQVLGFKRIFGDSSFYIPYFVLAGVFFFSLVIFASFSLDYEVFLRKRDALLFALGRIAITASLLFFPFLARYEPLSDGGYNYEPSPISWVIDFLVFFFIYLPSAYRFYKNVTIPLKELRVEFGKTNMVIYRYFNFESENYINTKTSIVRSPISYRLFRFSASMVPFTSMIIFVLPQTFSFKRLFDTSDTHLYFYWYLFSIGAFLASVLLFVSLSLVYQVFSKKRIVFYFIVGYVIFIGIMSLCSLYTKYTPLPDGGEMFQTHSNMFVFDILIIIFYGVPALEGRFMCGVRKPLKELWKQYNDKKERNKEE